MAQSHTAAAAIGMRRIRSRFYLGSAVAAAAAATTARAHDLEDPEPQDHSADDPQRELAVGADQRESVERPGDRQAAHDHVEDADAHAAEDTPGAGAGVTSGKETRWARPLPSRTTISLGSSRASSMVRTPGSKVICSLRTSSWPPARCIISMAVRTAAPK